MIGTTPTKKFNLPIDLSDIKNFSVTFSQDEEVIKKMKSDCTVEGNSIIAHLTQEDTLKLQEKKTVKVQIKLLFKDGNVLKTKIKSLYSGEILDKEVIT